MEKEEETTRELLLPNWQGSGSHGLTITQRDDGVFVQEVMQNSRAARTGVVKEGDQIVGATIYFDNLQSGEVAQLLSTMGHHAVGLKLHRKGDRSPEPGQTRTYDVFSSHSPDVVLSGDDEEYQRIYTTKIKPRLKPEDGVEGEPGETQSRTITVTRRVTAYTVDVTSREGAKDIDISSPEFKIKIPRHELTEISTVDVDTQPGKTVIRLPSGSGALSPTTGSTVDIQAGSISTSGPELQCAGDSKVQVTGPGIKVGSPGVSVSAKGLDLGSKGGVQVPGVDVLSSLGGGAAEWQGPALESGNDGKIKFPSMKLPKFGVSTGLEGQAPEGGLSVSAPEFSVGHKGGKPGLTIGGNIQTPQLEVSGPSASIKGLEGKLKGPQITGPSLEGDLGLKGTKPQGSSRVDISVPKIEGSIAGSRVEVQTPNIDIHGPGGKLNMPKVKAPKFSVSGSKGEGAGIDVTLPGVSGDVGLPEVASGGLEGKVKGPKIKTPEVTVQTPKISMQDVDLSLRSPKLKGDIKVSAPGVQGDVKGPQVAVKGAKVDIETPSLEGTVTGPKFSGPSGKEGTCKISMADVDLNVAAPKVKGGVDVTLPKVEGKVGVPEVDVRGPKVDVSAPDVDIHGPDWNLKMPKMKMPKFSTPGVKGEGPDVDVNLPKGDVSISGPKVSVEAPKVNIGGLVGNLKGPDVQLPEVSVKTPKITMPDVDLHVKGPKVKGQYDVTATKLEGEMRGPKVDIDAPNVDVHGPDWHLKMPKMKMPKFTVPGFKAEGPEVNVNLPEPDVDISGPKVDVCAPDVSIEGPEGKLKGPKFKMPEMNIKAPKISIPDVDLHLKGPSVKGEYDVTVPKVEGEIKVPDVELKSAKLDIDAPDVDIQGPDWHLKMPKMKMPKFSMPGFKGEGPEVDVNLPKADIDVSGPKVDIDVPDVDIEGPDAKLKGPKFKMPEMNIKAPKISVPDVDLDLKGSTGKGDFDVSVPKIEGTFKGPKVDLKGPGLDLEGPDAKLSGPHLKMPSLDISAPKVTAPDTDLHLKAPKIGVSGPKLEGGELDLKGPKVDFEAPSLDVHVESPDINTEGPDVKIPKFKKPKFGFGAKSPKADFKSPSLDVTVPEAELSVEAPEIGVGGKGKKSKFKMPKIHMSGPKIKAKKQGFDVNAPGGEIDASLKSPDADVNVAGPDASLKVDAKSPKTKKPMFGKMYFPDVEFDIKSPKFKAEASLPGPKMGGEIQAPDLDVSSPEINVEGPDIKLKAPKFKVPGVDVSGPKIEGDLKGPRVQANLDASDINIEGPDAKVKAPSFSISAPQVSIPDVNVNLKGPKIKGDVPSVGLEGPDVDLQGPESKIKFPKFSMPKIGVPGVKMEGGGTEVQLPSLEGGLSAPDVKLEGPDVSLKGPKIDLPSVNLSAPKVSGPDLDLNSKGPSLKGGLDVSVPSMKVHAPGLDLRGVGGKVKVEGDGMKVPGTDATAMLDVGAQDVTLKGPSLQGDLAVSGDIKCPEVSVGAPDLSLETPEGGVKLPKMKLPQFGISAPGSDLDIGVKGPQVAGELKGPGIDLNLRGPNLKGPQISGPQISAPDVDLNLEGPKAKGSLGASGDMKGPTVGGGLPGISVQGLEGNLQTPGIKSSRCEVELPGVNVKLPTGHISGPEIKGDLKGSGIGFHGALPDIGMKGPSFNVASPESDFGVSLKGPKIKGGMDVSGGVSAPDISLGEGHVSVKGSGGEWKGPQVSSAVNLDALKFAGGLHFSGPKIEGGVKGDQIGLQGPGLSVSGPQGHLESGSGKVTFPKMKIPKFTFSGRELVGREVGVDINFPKAEATVQSGAGEAEWEESDVKLKKSKIKMPKFNFSKPKGKPGVTGSPEASIPGSKGDLKSSKASLGSLEGEAEVETSSPKGKFSLFKSKKAQHRSNSFSEEREHSASSTPPGTLEFEGGEVLLEGGKVKGKHGKLKFGTFGGLGSKSKGHYEVTGSDDEAGKLQGSGVSLASKKSQLTSSSSDSGTKVGIQLPEVELTVSTKKE
ncbi:neuroblast differentiation-associated protein AHNAK isoform X3 [Sagmatias obliquidens]|uniref:neuroblast differentiation-associated protein AHNAK isoform X3 n=1 Tax=Sagmatias obliquidens TaxID=3371155 RepID=UPI000F43FDC9|nr:neuroblast differentiation-associated protein AHNAK isoform X3 [Lagenorhynchus obliquidens]